MAGKKRTTADIESLKDMINYRITRCETLEARKELCSLLESILHGANQYGGFWYSDGYKGVEDYQRRYY